MAWIVGALVLLVAGSAWMTQPLLLAGDCVKHGAAPDSERLEHRVRDLVGLFYPRDFTHTENLARAARFIGEEFRRAGAAVSEQLFQAAGESYRNVVAAFGPDTGEVIVVGAHYDLAGEFPGADDNASGVAGLLELADLLAGAKLSRRVELAAYALEEMPFSLPARWEAPFTPARSERPGGGSGECCASR